ncbi:MAG: Rpn family recombination-promoting nuclease/putative transposase [Oscillospiraceae bacterium]|nr:Rpn family recombination-promoting nuclease/putative transposase [Oscillospiraceae bacterium]
MDTGLKNTLMMTEEMSTQYDTLAKNILSRRSVLSHILKATVEDLHDIPPEEIESLIEDEIYVGNVPVDAGFTNAVNGDRVVGLNTVQAEQFEGMIVYDIVFYVRIGDERSKIIINIEAQKDEPSGYNILNRAIFYVSRLISSQKERDFTGRNFDDLSRVYSIWICMNMDKCIWNHYHLTNDEILGGYDWKGKPDMLNIVLLGLPMELPPQDEKFKLHRMLSALFAEGLKSSERINVLENEYSIPAVHEFGEELNAMCNLGQGVYERGEERGRQREREERNQEQAVKLYKKGWSLSEIAEFLECSMEDLSVWLKLT